MSQRTEWIRKKKNSLVRNKWHGDSHYLSSIGEVRPQIHVHVHVRILDRGNGLDVIQPEALGNLTKVRRGHRVQEPRHDPLDAPGLLLRELVYHGRLRHALDVDVVGGLPRSEVGAAGGGGGGSGGAGLGGMRSSVRIIATMILPLGTVRDVRLVDAGDGACRLSEERKLSGSGGSRVDTGTGFARES